jgi:hypothetical protein
MGVLVVCLKMHKETTMPGLALKAGRTWQDDQCKCIAGEKLISVKDPEAPFSSYPSHTPPRKLAGCALQRSITGRACAIMEDNIRSLPRTNHCKQSLPICIWPQQSPQPEGPAAMDYLEMMLPCLLLGKRHVPVSQLRLAPQHSCGT